MGTLKKIGTAKKTEEEKISAGKGTLTKIGKTYEQESTKAGTGASLPSGTSSVDTGKTASGKKTEETDGKKRTGLGADSGYTEEKKAAQTEANRAALKAIAEAAKQDAQNRFGGLKNDAETQRQVALANKMGTGESWQDTRATHAVKSGVSGSAAGFVNAAGAMLGSLESEKNFGLAVDSGKIPEKATGEEWNNRLGRKLRPAVEALQGTADKIQAYSQKEYEAGTEGLNTAQRMLFDVGVAGTQMLGDMTAGAATGGALVPMAARVFGSGAQEARQAGATRDQQLLYGALSAGVELFTEKMFDGVAKVYGKGAADEIVERVAGKLAKSEVGQSVVEALIGAGGEGLEEVVSGLLSPAISSIYDGKSVGENYDELEASELLYEGIVGAMMGGLSAPVSVVQSTQAKKMENTLLNYVIGQESATAEEVNERLTSMKDNEKAARETFEEAIRKGRVVFQDGAFRRANAAQNEKSSPVGSETENAAEVKTAENGAASAQEATEAEGEETTHGEGETRTQEQEDVKTKMLTYLLGDGSTEEEVNRRLSQMKGGAQEAAGNILMKAMESGEVVERDGKYYKSETRAQAEQDYEREMELREAGVHGDTAWMEKGDAEYLNQLAKAGRVSIEIVDTLGQAQGTYDPKTGRIQIAKDAEDPVGFVTQHELTHRMKQSSPEKWSEFLGYVQEYYGERWDSVVEQTRQRYAESNIELTAEEAAEEVAADFAGSMDEAEIRRLTQENRSLAQKILDAIRSLIRKLKGGEVQRLYRMEKLWADALKEGNENAAPEGGVRYSFAGEKAKTADLDALARAKEMEKQGVAADIIRRETGWFTGADGKWRFEIDDSRAEYRRDGDAQLMKEPEYRRLQELTQKWADSFEKGGEALTEAEAAEMETLQEEYSDAVWEEKYLLRDFLHHDELFEAYPYLNRVSLDFDDLPDGVKGRFSRKTNTITLSNDLIGATENTLLHEIQHVIQKVEGFSGGSSPEYWAVRDAKSGEVKNRLAQERKDIFESLSREDRNKYTRYKELEQELERLSAAEDGTEDGNRYLRYDRESDKLYLELWGKDWFQKLGTLDRKLESGLGEEYNRLYRNTAGEIEARDTANRRKLTAEERRAKAPDTGNENTVFADGAGYMSEQEAARDEEILHLKDQIRANLEEINKMDPVADVKTPENFPKKVSDRRAWVLETLKTTEVHRSGLGKVNIGANQIRRGLMYAKEQGDIAAFAALPGVIKRGREIMSHGDHKGNGVKTITFAGSVIINGKRGVMGVVVHQTSGNNYKAHKLLMPDGSAFVLDGKKEAKSGPVMAQLEKSRLDKRTDYASSNASIRPSAEKSNTQNEETKKSLKGSKTIQEEIDRLTRQNERLKQEIGQLTQWNEQMKLENRMLTDTVRLETKDSIDRRSVETLARELKKRYASKVSVGSLSGQLVNLYDGMGQNRFSQQEMRERARFAADTLLDAAEVNTNPLYEEYADLRKTLRTEKVTLAAEDRADIQDGYNELRKKAMGKVRMGNDGTPVDAQYEKLSEQYPELFPGDIMNPADQLQRMVEVSERLQRVMESAFSGKEGEHIRQAVANDLLEQFFDISTTQGAKLQKMQNEWKKQRAKDREATDRRIAKLAERQRQELADLKREYAEANRRRQESMSTTALRDSIGREALRLGKKLTRPTDKNHVPEEYRGAVAELVRLIDTESGYDIETTRDGKFIRVRKGEGTPTKKTDAARALKAEIESLQKANELTIDPEIKEYLNDIAGMKDIPLAEMNKSQLETVWKVVRAVSKMITDRNKMFGQSKFETVSAAAGKMMLDNGTRRDRVSLPGSLGALRSLFDIEMMTPETFFHELGKAGDDLFRQFRQAADRQTRILKEATDLAARAVEESGLDVKKLEKETETFHLESGEEITLTKAQLMELYELTKREQAKEHIFLGGVKSAGYEVKGKLGKRIETPSKASKVTMNDVGQMLKTLTAEEKKLADTLQKYMSGALAMHGNETSYQVYGYSKFTERNYWPIKVNRGETQTDVAAEAKEKTIPSYGMTRTVIPKASNGLTLSSFMDTYTNHINQMATYAAWLGASENANRLYNYQFRDENGIATGETIKNLFQKVYGREGGAYFEKLMADIAQGTKAGADQATTDKLFSNYKAAAVGANARVVLQQPTAILRAAEVIDPKYLIENFGKKGGWEKALKHSPLAQWKDWGYFELDTGRSLRQLIVGSESKVERLRELSMAPAGWGDSIAWGLLWNAVESETADKRGDLARGSEAFYEAANDRFEDIIYRTQVVDNVLNRSQAMRKNGVWRLATSFMSEPSKVYNMMQRNIRELNRAQAENNEAAKKKAWKHIARTAAALTASFAANAVAQALADAERDDDRDEKPTEKFWAEWLENFWGGSAWDGLLVGNFGIGSYVPLAKDALSIIQGHDVERMDMSAFADAWSAIEATYKAWTGSGSKTKLAASVDAALQLCKAAGLPAANVKREVHALLSASLLQAGQWKAMYELDKLLLNQENSRSQFYDTLYYAMLDDWEDYEDIYADMLENGFTEKNISNNMETRIMKAEGVSKVSELPIRWGAPGTTEGAAWKRYAEENGDVLGKPKDQIEKEEKKREKEAKKEEKE